jgi:hypothetical protein
MAQSQSRSVRGSSFYLNVQACRSAMFLVGARVTRHKDKSPRPRRMGIPDSRSDSNVSVHSQRELSAGESKTESKDDSWKLSRRVLPSSARILSRRVLDAGASATLTEEFCIGTLS